MHISDWRHGGWASFPIAILPLPLQIAVFSLGSNATGVGALLQSEKGDGAACQVQQGSIFVEDQVSLQREADQVV